MDRDARGGCGTLYDRIRSAPESAETGEGDPLAAVCNENGIHTNVPRVRLSVVFFKAIPETRA